MSWSGVLVLEEPIFRDFWHFRDIWRALVSSMEGEGRLVWQKWWWGRIFRYILSDCFWFSLDDFLCLLATSHSKESTENGAIAIEMDQFHKKVKKTCPQKTSFWVSVGHVLPSPVFTYKKTPLPKKTPSMDTSCDPSILPAAAWKQPVAVSKSFHICLLDLLDGLAT